jgi:hypothetical protein
MPLPAEYAFNSFLPPALVRPSDGNTYVCPGWIPVPSDTTLEEVHSRWTPRVPEIEKAPTAIISETVKSSSGKGGYLVEFNGKSWSCSCPGFGFRRDCKHVRELKLKNT